MLKTIYSIAFALVAYFVLLGGVFFGIDRLYEHNATTPNLALNDCFVFDTPHESWETVHTYKVIQIGERGYKVAAAYPGGGQMDLSSSVSFISNLKKVQCP